MESVSITIYSASAHESRIKTLWKTENSVVRAPLKIYGFRKVGTGHHFNTGCG